MPYYLYLIGIILCTNSLYAQPMLEGPAIPDIMVDVDFSDSLDVIQFKVMNMNASMKSIL